jgi:hypothetical protein
VPHLLHQLPENLLLFDEEIQPQQPLTPSLFNFLGDRTNLHASGTALGMAGSVLPLACAGGRWPGRRGGGRSLGAAGPDKEGRAARSTKRG